MANQKITTSMDIKPFVTEDSVVRQIWGKGDTVLFIFAGAAAEFALNKAVDWLYFTGKLPSDPLGRLFSTVGYARKIIFSPEAEALAAIDTIRRIHTDVEQSRGTTIPDWAYRDVLFMLIHYSIASYELLERQLTDTEKEEVYDVFYRVGTRMGITALPLTYSDWLPVRQDHLIDNFQRSHLTDDLFMQYKKHLGGMRYAILVEAQKLVVPDRVKSLLHFSPFAVLVPVISIYKFSRLFKMDQWLRNLLLPAAYQVQISNLDVTSSRK